MDDTDKKYNTAFYTIDANESRVSSLDEKQAYKNLKMYDNGDYFPKKVKDLIKVYKYSDFEDPICLKLNRKNLREYINYGVLINSKHSEFHPGEFSDENNYEASFSKKVYYESELQFIVELFIAHHNIHAFMDGNKRTALNYFLDLLYKYTSFYVKNVITIQDAQIHYLVKEINELQFRNIILSEVKKRMVKQNTRVHLEHLIPRMEFEETLEEVKFSPSERKSSFTLSDLEKDAFFYNQLKKPYFQRDTNEWSVERVQKLIDTFLEDGLIPAIIMWESHDGDLLIIDGGHRVSSLIAWINNDFGNSELHSGTSNTILSEHFDLNVGNYKEIKASNNIRYKKLKSIIAKKSIPIQWVIGDYEKVKESFIRINEQGVTLSNDEKELIENDKLPTSKLARAILSHGTGQNSKYASENTNKIYEYFFLPTFVKDNLIYPMLGAVDEEFVISRVFNVIKIIDNKENKTFDSLVDNTLEMCGFMHNYLQISNKSYFYGSNQRFKTSSLFGFTMFALRLKKDNQLLEKFIKNRAEFEEFLTNNEKFVQEISRRRRQSSKAIEDICKYYEIVLKAISENNIEIVFEEFPYLSGRDGNLTSRQKVILYKYQQFLNEIPRCVKCGGFIDGNKKDKKTHYCCE